MLRVRRSRRPLATVCFLCCLAGLSLGLSCPGTGDPYNPYVPPGNRPPRIIITSVTTPQGELSQTEQGTPVTIGFEGEDGEDVAVARVFASTDSNPTSAEEIPIMAGFNVGPGAGTGDAVWDTSSVSAGTYYIFAEIDDRTYDPNSGVGNPAVRSTFPSSLTFNPKGTNPLNTPPQLVFIDPAPNLGLSVQDEVTIRYIYVDTDSDVTLTLLLDKDLDPTNDDITSPGDPLNPESKIIILPSAARLFTDPTFDGDPPPPDNAANPPDQPDSLEIRTNPRTLGATAPNIFPYVGAPLAGELKEYRFVVDFSQILVRSEPYYIRATIDDGDNTVHRYAVGSLTISEMAAGTVDVGELGFRLAGCRFQGFSDYENLGTDFEESDDIDFDGVNDFMLASRFASPRNRYQSGAAYLLFGRRKTPFPPDTNDNGLPDTLVGTTVVDFPEPPDYVSNPYDSANVGRFGGVMSINSVGSFFRGAVYAMPMAHDTIDPPATVADLLHPLAYTAGLTSITRLDMTGDAVPDLVFGLPYVSTAWDNADYDPVDGCEAGYGEYRDGWPNWVSDGPPATNDDMSSPRNPPGFDFFENSINQGLVIMVDGTNDINEFFGAGFVDAALAGQHDPDGAFDDEGVLNGAGLVPRGMRFRGMWWDEEVYDPNFWGSTLGGIVPFARKPTDPNDPLSGPGAIFYSDSEFGRTVNRLPDYDNLFGDELLLSLPGYSPLREKSGPGGWLEEEDLNRGSFHVRLSGNYLSENWYGEDGVMSLISYTNCSEDCAPSSIIACRAYVISEAVYGEVLGQRPGDRFGFADSAGDFNQDGTEDIVAGAPGADRNGLTDCGVMYVLAVPVGGFGKVDMASNPPQRLEVIGIHNNDQFGLVQTGIEDMSTDSIQDVAFGSETYAGPNGPDSGYVGVIFGARPITGEGGFSPEAVGTAGLPGIRFYGAAAGARAGHDVASAGDFNGDGVGDLLITSPGEMRTIGGQLRKGVTYLIFGGRHLVDMDSDANTYFFLSQVGSPQLPGIVFISRFRQGTVDEASLDIARSVGDIDGDGFDDIMIGAPTADFVFPATPSQRRPDAGEAYIVYGSNFGSNRLP